MVKCPICKTIYAAKLVGAHESFDDPPMIEEIIKEEQYIKLYGMCRKCYNFEVVV